MIKELPLVSIVAINYNNSKYIIETLDSIANQTYENIELIIVDDCSTDNSVEKIDHWLLNFYKSYQFIKHSINQGVCKTINDGYKKAKGKYITSIATDDIMLLDKIQKQVELLEKTGEEVGMLYSDAYLIGENNEPMEGMFIKKYGYIKDIPPSGDLYKILLKGNFIPAMSILIKKTVFKDIGYFDENLYYEDYDMWLRIAKKYQIIYSEFPSVKYRIREKGLALSTEKEIWNYNNLLIYFKHKDMELGFCKIKEITYSSFLDNQKSIKKLIKKHMPNFKLINTIWGIYFLPHKIKIKLYAILDNLKK